MAATFIDGRLSVDLPEGFRVLGADELQAAYGMAYEDMWGARDETRHVALTVIWKDSGEMLTKLAGEKSLAKRTEKALSKRYRRRAYQMRGFFERQVADMPAQGFRYAFCDSTGAPQECETLIFKQGARCYTLYYYARADLADQNMPVHDTLVASMQISG